MSRRTALYDRHVKLGGKMVKFAGFEMPLAYQNGIMSETKRVRSTAGLFDVSHMGEIEISGSDCLNFLNRIITNDADELGEFQVQYTCMCYPDGGIVDDLLIYRLPGKYLLVVNAANTVNDLEWIVDNKLGFAGIVSIENRSDRVSQLALQGPDSQRILDKLVDFDLEKIGYYHSQYAKVSGKEVLVSRTGYTGEDGFEIYSSVEDTGILWDAILEAGSESEIEPVGLGARDLLRLEMGYCLYGNDIDETTTPLEAGLGWVTRLKKDEFVGKDALVKQKESGLTRRLVPFELKGRAIPRQDYPILSDGRRIGDVTSGNFSPSVEKSIGMGYVEFGRQTEGTGIEIDVRGKPVEGVIVKSPFVKSTSLKR